MQTTTTTPDPIDTLKSHKCLCGGIAIAALLFAFEWSHLRQMTHAPAPLPAVREVGARVIRAEGRVVTYPGAQAIVGTDVGGRLRSLPLTEKMRVEEGGLVAAVHHGGEAPARPERRVRVAAAE